MPTMTPELQAAYNEWLLKFGFREVPLSVMRAARPMLNDSEITTYEDWQRCVIVSIAPYPDRYRLKTLEEIEIYDTKTARSL